MIGVKLGKIFYDDPLALSLSFGVVALFCAVVMFVERSFLEKS